jgi:hypothetical protein
VGLDQLRAPDGAPVLVQKYPSDQCSAQIRFFLLRSAKDTQDFRITVSRELEGVCPMTKRAELHQDQQTLTGAQVLERDLEDGQGKWTQSGSVVFAKGQYVFR